MRVIIAGGRDIAVSDDEMDMYVDEWERIHGTRLRSVVCGMARGVDTSGRNWAERRGVPVWQYPADWDTHGRSAGPIRNREMAENADGLILVWDGTSRGSASMLSLAREHKLRIYEVRTKKGG